MREYERAAELEPKRCEPHYRAAELLNAYWVSYDDNHFDAEEAKRGIRHWNEWQNLCPRDTRLARALFRRSIAYTKLGGEDNYRNAIADSR